MADTTISITSVDVSKLKVPDLKKELKAKGLSTAGNKNELVERLKSALESNDIMKSDSVDDLEEDLLNEDDDDEHLDGTESVINDIDKALDDSPTTKPEKRKLDEDDTQETKNGTSKKIIINRSISTIETTEPKIEIQEQQTTVKQLLQEQEKKIVKLSELTVKERLELRAKKFGVTITSDAKRAARVERFGSNADTSSTANIKTNVNTSLDVLKQRAARFGQSVSSVMSDLEKKERLEKRKARFGVISTATSPVTNGSMSEAAKRRLERFKQPVK